MFLFCSSRIKTLLAMATYSFPRLIMGKVEIWHLFLSQCGILDFVHKKCVVRSPQHFI